jgi:Uncharacterized protein conserved in bacteria
MLSASVLYDRGVALSNAGKHAAARRALDQALQRTDDDNLRARISGTMAFIVLETGQPDEAADLCANALRIPGISDHTKAVLLGQQGLVEMRRGELPAASRLLTRALRVLAHDAEHAGWIFMNRGIVDLELGRLAGADDDFGSAARCFAELGRTADVAKAQHNQGYVALLRGDLVAASTLMDAARPLAAAASPVDAAVGDVDRAEVLLAAGMPDEAAARLASAARVYRARRLRQLQADATWRLARTMLYSEPRRAASGARRAVRLYRSHGNETGALRAQAVALRADVAAGRRSQALIDALEATAASLGARRIRDEATDLRLSAARVRVRRGDLVAAQAALRRSSVRTGGPIVGTTLVHEVRTEFAVARGDDSSALREAARGLDRLAQWQATFGSLDLQSSLDMHGRVLTAAGISAALRSGDVATVFDWSERARQLASHSVRPRPPGDHELAAALDELRLLRFRGALDAAGARRDVELRERVEAHRWSGEGDGRLPERVPIDRVQRLLVDDDAVLIGYLWSGERLAALVVEPDRSCIVDLARPSIGREATTALQAELDMHAEGLPGAMGAAVRRSLTERLAGLSAELIDPVLAVSERAARCETRLAIVNPGILAGVPWSMLPGLAARTVTLPTSATRWAAQRAQRNDPDARCSTASAGLLAGPNVPRAAEEIARSAAAWPRASIAGGADATTDLAAELARRVDVLHMTGHGRHAADNPHFSGIELADGPWFGYDIESLDRVPQIVVLSACELGRSAVNWGHEALGMARTWLHTGATCVIASPANVNDDAACELLPAVHSLLASGAEPAQALAAASAGTGASTPFLCYGSGW